MRASPAPPAPRAPDLAELTRTFLRIGLVSFGGPAGQIALMHRVLIEEKGWLDEARYLNALNLCTLLPGPEAQQLATFTGWMLGGWRGGVVAGVLFVLPGFLVIVALSAIYWAVGNVPLVTGVLLGLKAAVLAIVLQALWKVANRALHGPLAWAIAAAAFVALFAFAVPFPVVVVGAAIAGAVGWRSEAPSPTTPGASLPPNGFSRAARILGLFALLWALPPLLLVFATNGSGAYGDIALFFSKMAVLTFGGAYAVLAWVAQEAVAVHGWLNPAEMIDGLALAETTPGPLILVLSFVGFLGAARDGAGFDPLLAGIAGASVTVWVTFVPCFLWIFLLAPYVDAIRQRRSLANALRGITASVVGVILNLSLWFALHVLFRSVESFAAGPLTLHVPVLASLDWRAALLAALAFAAVFRLRLGLLPTLGSAAIGGLVLSRFG